MSQETFLFTSESVGEGHPGAFFPFLLVVFWWYCPGAARLYLVSFSFFSRNLLARGFVWFSAAALSSQSPQNTLLITALLLFCGWQHSDVTV